MRALVTRDLDDAAVQGNRLCTASLPSLVIIRVRSSASSSLSARSPSTLITSRRPPKAQRHRLHTVACRDRYRGERDCAERERVLRRRGGRDQFNLPTTAALRFPTASGAAVRDGRRMRRGEEDERRVSWAPQTDTCERAIMLPVVPCG